MEQRLVESPPSDSEGFLAGYDALIAQFSSGGLHRGKTRIAKNFNYFLEALRQSQGLKQASPLIAYTTPAECFSDISNAGVNVITEILLSRNCKRFANMNKNSVAGMTRANITHFPERPLKTNVGPHVYAEFCTEADRLRKRLDLSQAPPDSDAAVLFCPRAYPCSKALQSAAITDVLLFRTDSYSDRSNYAWKLELRPRHHGMIDINASAIQKIAALLKNGAVYIQKRVEARSGSFLR